MTAPVDISPEAVEHLIKRTAWNDCYPSDEEINAMLRALRAALTARDDALRFAELFFTRPDESANDRFERAADAFYRDTGQLAPGKDAGLYGPSHEARKEVWDQWMRKNTDALRTILANEPDEDGNPDDFHGNPSFERVGR